MNSSAPFVRFSIILLILVLGCEEDLPLRESIDEPFTLYGVLSPDLDTQSVHVYPIEDFPSLLPADSLDISFTSTDLNTGTQAIWKDTILTRPNGQHDLVFWAPFRTEFGHSYRVEATRIDGASSYADVHIPLPVTIRIVEGESPEINKVPLQVFIEGSNFRALKPELIYNVKGKESQFRIGDTLSIKRMYHGMEQPSENGWEFSMNLYLDWFWVQSEYNVRLPAVLGILCQVLDLRKMDLHVVIGDTLWNPPGGRFDPNLLSHPQALSNVENGLGFVGGGYKLIAPITPSREAVAKACFNYAL